MTSTDTITDIIRLTVTDNGEPHETSTRSSSSDIGRRAAGIGALTFASAVVVQNIIRANAPMPGDDIETVVGHFADHRPVTVVLLVTFAIALAGLSAFLGGSMRILLAGPRRGWAIVGGLAAATIIALFSGVAATEQALTVVATSPDPNIGVAEALWTLHNSLFTVNLMFIALALVGLSRAGISCDVTPRPFRMLAPIAAGLLLLGTVAGPYIAAGEAMPLFGLSVIGFLVWLGFLATTGRRLLSAEA